ncbi:MAG: hypothetical protein ACRDI2_20465 [Chloroflexota bacterium]
MIALKDVSEAETEPEFLSVAQVARRLGCSVSLVQKWRRLRWLPATRLGPPNVPVYGYRPADVDRFARERWNRQRGRPAGQTAGSRSGPPARTTTERRHPPSEARPAAEAAGGSQADIGRERFKPAQLQPVATQDAAIGRGARVFRPLGDTGQAGQGHEPPPPASQTTAPAAAQQGDVNLPALPATSGKPLVLWDGDPHEGTALVLGRFPASELRAAISVAEMWARRYDELVLAEAAGRGDRPNVLLRWRRGERLPG